MIINHRFITYNLQISKFYVYNYGPLNPLHKFKMAKRVSTKTKSAVFEHFTVTTDGKYYQCQCVVGDDDGEKVCDAKFSSST